MACMTLPAAEEEEALEERMGHQVEDARRKCTRADAHEHVAELAHGRVGEHPLDIVLGAADCRSEEGGQHPYERDDEHRRRRHDVEEVEPGDHVDAGRNHRRRMDERADRRRAFHCIGQPDVERYLRGLARCPDEEEKRNERRCAARNKVGVFLKLAEVERPDAVRAESRQQEEDAEKEAEVAYPVDDERLLACVRRAVFLVPEADQEIGAQTDAFPADEHEEHVVRRHQYEHHEDEEVQVREVPGIAFVVVHIARGVDVDEKAHARHHQAHDNRERIDPETDPGGEIA